MKHRNSVLAILSSLLLVGCSSAPSSEPKYDQVELIHYEGCIDFYLNGVIAKGGTYVMADLNTKMAMEYCAEFLPTKE